MTKIAESGAKAQAAANGKPKKERKKLTLSAALRRIELIMEQFAPPIRLKLAEYAMMHAQECQPAPTAPNRNVDVTGE